MIKQEYIDYIEANVGEKLPEQYQVSDVHIQQVEKISGSYTGLCIVPEKKGFAITPTFNLDDLYEKESDPAQAVDMIAEQFGETMEKLLGGEMPEIENVETIFRDYNLAKERFLVTPISPDRAGVMTDIPQQEMNGMHFAVKLMVSRDKNEMASATIMKSHLEAWGISNEKLFEDAWESMKKLDPGNLMSLRTVLEGFTGEMDLLGFEPLPEGELEFMYVYSNEMRLNGAASLFIDGALDDVSHQLNDESFFVLPSSVHECLIVPDRNYKLEDYESLYSMLRDGNATLITKEELLSETPYHYDAKEGILEEVKDYAKRMGVVEEEDLGEMMPEPVMEVSMKL